MTKAQNTPTDNAPNLADFVPFKKYALEYEKLGLGTAETLRWIARFRETNGLLASGALIELRSPGSRRPRLIFNRRKFPQWLENQSISALGGRQ